MASMRRLPLFAILAAALTIAALAVGLTCHLRLRAQTPSGLFLGAAIAEAVPAGELGLLRIPGDERVDAFSRCTLVDRPWRSALTDRALYVLDEQDGGCRRFVYADIQLAAVLAGAEADRPMMVSFARRGGGVDDVAVLVLAAADGPRFLTLLQARGIEVVRL